MKRNSYVDGATLVADAEDDVSQRQFLLAELQSVARAVVQTLGENLCEVVIHDFAEPESSIVYIQGKVTRRKAGGSMSQIGLAMLAEGNEAEEKINYITRTRDGKVLKSSTTPLRDANGEVFGAFCLNIDITGLSALESTLRELVSGDQMKVLANIHFGNDTAEVAQVMLEEACQHLELVGPPREMSECLEFVRALDKKGFFGIRYSVPLLADYLGVSRATIYNYLDRSRESS